MRENKAIFQGSIKKILIRLATPIFIGLFFNTFYGIADTYFLSLIDKNSTSILSGLGIVFPLSFFFLALSQGFNTGVATLVSIGIGKKDSDMINKSAVTGIVCSVITALIVSVLAFIFIDKIFIALAGNRLSPDAIQNGKTYFLSLLPGTIFFFTSNVLLGILQGEGKTKHIGITMMLSTFLNLILDPIFIFVFNMGIQGAGFATVTAQFAGFIYTIALFTGEISDIKLSPVFFDIKKIVMIGEYALPQSLGLIAMSFSFLLLNKLISSIGEDAMNAFTLVIKTDGIMIIPILALSRASLAITGQNFGRQNYHRIKQVYYTVIKIGFLIILALAAIYIAVAPYYFSLFTNVPNVLNLCVKQVKIMSTVYIATMIIIISRVTFQAIGKPIKALVIVLIRMGMFAVPLSYLFAKLIIGMRIESVWLGIALGNILGAIVAFIWCVKYMKRWEKI